MKYAVCLRGISYLTRTYRDSDTPFTIDFNEVASLIQKNIIDDLRENGHTVDLFFYTYDSIMLKEYIDLMNPKKVDIRILDLSVGDGNSPNIVKIWFNSLKVALDYEKETNIKYDYFISIRFDHLYFEKISNLCLPSDAISALQKGDDLFNVIPSQMMYPFLNTLQKMYVNKDIVHTYGDNFNRNGYKCNNLYSVPKDFNRRLMPLHHINRSVFIDKNHPFKEFNLEDLLNPNSDCYVYTLKPSKEPIYT